MPGFDDYKNDATKGSELKDLMVLVASRMKVSDSVVAEALNRIVTRVEALESLVGSDVVGKEDLQKYAKQVQAAKTFSPDRTKTLSAMSQNDNGEMSATFAEVQATVVSQNNYTSPGSTKTALSTIFGKIWNFFGMLLKSTGTWNGSSDAQIPTTAAVQAKLDEKQGLVGINSSSGDPLKLLNQKGEWVTSPALVNVTSYTSYSSITAVASDGAQPYYAHTDGSLVVYLMYVGVSTPTGPGQSVALVFCGVSNGSIYRTSFTNGNTSFAQVSKMPVFSSDNVIDSSSQSAWSTDDINVPTRAAVEAKISSAMSGSLGGFLGPKSPDDISLYQLSGHTFLKGDWFVVSESGTAYYYPNNDRSASRITLNMLEGEEYYWTTSGTFVKNPSTSLQIYAITNLSDWNDLTSPGLYHISVGGVTNAPAAGAFSCLVSNVNGNIRQVAMQSDNIYYRGKGSQSGWTSWRNVNDVDSAKNYSSGGTIEQALAARQANIYWWDGTNGGTSSNPGATKHYVDSVIQGSWMLTNYDAAVYEIIQNVTGNSLGSGNLPTDYKINASLYYADTAERVVVMGSVATEMIVPGYMTVSGVRRQMKQRVRYRLTINNTSANNVEIRVCGGGSWRGDSDPSPTNTFMGSVYVDGNGQSTDTQPWTWSSTYKNDMSLGTVPAHGGRTWEIWWEESTNTSGYKSHKVYVTTIH